MAKKKYTSYKPSKTLWQEEIPSHWQETDLRMIFSENKVKNIDLVERNLLSLSYGKLKRKDIDNATGLVPASFEGYQIIDEGYIILRFTDLQNDKKSLRVGYCPERGIITNAYVGIVPNEDIHSKYFYYQLHFLDTIKYFYNLGGGVRQSLSYKEFKRETILVPELEEQTKIAAFLDYKLAKINRFIQKKKQLIKLLNEQKEAIINQAVTKGLDPNAKMKDSGIEWLGEIPEHWEVRKLKYVADVVNGATPKSDNSDYWNGEVIWLTPEDISKNIGKEVFESNRKITSTGLESCGTTLVPRGSIILTTRAPIGNICKAGVSLCTNQGCKSIAIKDSNYSENYLMYFLLANKNNLQSFGRGTTFMELSTNNLKSFPVIYPDSFEDILGHIEQETDTINITISKIEKELALTEEYKTALIAEAVTGKIDVRDFEIPASNEDENYEDIEEELSIAAEGEAEYQTEEIE